MTLGDVAGNNTNTNNSAGTPAPVSSAPATPPASSPAAASPAPANLGAGNPAPTQASWRDSLPDDLKADATLSKYSDIPNLAKAHVELQKLIGQKNAGAIIKPAANASPEAIKAFREQLGIPTEIDKYDLGTFEGVKVDQPIIDWAKKMGVEHGIEPSALKAVISDYMKLDATNQGIAKAAAEAKTKEAIGELRKEWGDAFEQNLKAANFAAEKIGGKPLIEALVKANVHNDPAILKAFANASKLYKEDTLREGGVGSDRVTPAELDGKIAQVQSRLFAMKPTDGNYQATKHEYESLWKQKTGGR